MSRPPAPRVTIGCPTCSESVSAAVPGDSGLRSDGGDRGGALESLANEPRLNGLEHTCENCGHTVELYYY